jgi:hypothetical protein
MSEIVPDSQEGTGLPEPQGVGMGRTRVQLALISAAVPVLLGVFGLAPRLIGNDEAQAIAAFPTADETSAASAPPVKRWRIEGHVEPSQGQGPIDVALLLMPLENGAWAKPDDQGHFEFDVPPGAYSLSVTSLDGSDIPDIKVTVNKNPEEPVKSFLSLPAPLKVVTITEQ